MLKQASVSDLLSDRVSREKGYIVITMRRYPRFVNRALRDEYISCMSPEPKLFEDWLSAKRRHADHDRAFARSRFEERFDIGEDGWRELERLCELSKKQDVYFVCQCHEGRRCHREFLLLLAKKIFKVRTQKPAHEYPTFEARLPELRKRLKALKRSLIAPKASGKAVPKPAKARRPTRSPPSTRDSAKHPHAGRL